MSDQSTDSTATTVSFDLIKIPKRSIVKYNGRHEIIASGSDNAYPTRMERLVNSSPTALQASRVFSKFIRGSGFRSDLSDVVIGSAYGNKITPIDLLAFTAKSLSYHRGFFWHIAYNLLGEVVAVTPVPFRYCRFGKQDSDEYSGKIRVYDNWDLDRAKTIRKDEIQTFDVFNPDPAVVQYQIEKAGGIYKYGGQIYFSFLEIEDVYPLATIDVAQNDAFAEYQFGVFKKQTLVNDFLTQLLVFRHAPFEKETDRDEFKKAVKGTKGAENAGNILTMEDTFSPDLPNGTLRIEEVKSNLDSKIFESWEKSCSNNIRRAFNNVPEILINEVEGKFGNSSGEGIRQAREYFNSQVLEEQDLVARSFSEVLSRFQAEINAGDDWTIVPLDSGLQASNSQNQNPE